MWIRIVTFAAQQKRKVQKILSIEQEPFWLTGGSIALSNLSVTPPPEAKWWWPQKIAFVFVRHIAVRFSVDAHTCALFWENASAFRWSSDQDQRLEGKQAAEILAHLCATNSRYQRLVKSFSSLASLEDEYAFLENLKAEADRELAEEQRSAELKAAQRKAADASKARFDPREGSSSAPSEHSNAEKASWDTLIIPRNLRESLQAYCRILRDYRAYQAVGVRLPKGLLLYGPPGCGKTQIAKTLSAEGGLNFVPLSTSDCKAMWIGHSADRLANVFREAREKQPSLIFIDELDAVCPPRGAYHDCMSQEFTAQLLQEVDGISSDSQAIFLIGATNRPDQVDSAILSRFAEQIEIPLPNAATRVALLELFLGSMHFAGKRERVVLSLVRATKGKSGRDLRAVVNHAVLSAVKRSSSPRDFALSEEDFALPQTSPSSKPEATPGATGCDITTASDAVSGGCGTLPVSPDEGAEEESTIGIPNPAGARIAPLLKQNTASALVQALREHAASLSADDTRVKKQVDGLFKGEQFTSGDALHEHLLANVPEEEKAVLNAAQAAIANRVPMNITYASALQERLTEESPTTRSRQIEYEMSSPQARLLGQTRGQLAGHSFIPTSIGVSLAWKQGEPHQGYIHGISTNAAANNWYQLNKALIEAGSDSPYPKLGNKFYNDLEGYISNLNAGHRGTGDQYAPGTEQYPAQIDRNHVPYRLTRREANFLNAVINNQAAKAKSAEGLRELARRGGTLLTEDGETNPIRHAIDVRQAGIRQRLAEDPENIDNPEIQKAAQRLWSEDILEPTIRRFKAGLVHSIHKTFEEIPEDIRPRKEFKELTKTLHRQMPMGRPDVPISVAFMPGGGRK